MTDSEYPTPNAAEKRLLGGLVTVKKAKGKRKVYFLGIPVWKILHDDKGTRHHLFGFLCVFRKIQKVPDPLPDPHFMADNFSPFAMDDRILIVNLKKLGEFTYVPNPGNMGDMLIASATLQFFDRNRLPYRMFDGGRADAIVFGGGGIWTKDYEEWQPWILSLFADAKRILILPSSFNNCGMLVKALDSRFIVFCREKESFDYLAAQKTRARVLLDHDMAFRLTPDILHGGIFLKRKREMDAAREAAKRVFRIFHDTPKVIRAMRLDCESAGAHETDGDLSDCAHGGATASRMYIDFITKLMLAAVDSADAIITDRLHVGIAGALMGKEVHLLDNSYGKISGVYKHTLMDNPRVHFTDQIPCGIVPKRTATDNLQRLENNFKYTSLGDSIVKYIDFGIPTRQCNLRCHYCYVGQHGSGAPSGKIEKFQYSPEQTADALSVRRLGGIAIVNFCASGETMIAPQNLAYIKAILGAGHFAMIVSNMTQTRATGDLLALPKEWRERLFFKASLHWLELKRLNLLDVFADNLNSAWNAGISITVEITPSDELEPEIPEIKEYCMKHFGALAHITVPRDENSNYKMLTKRTAAEFRKIWGQFDSALFDFKMSIWGEKVRKFCYCGDWGYTINMASGKISPCWSYSIGNLFPRGKGRNQAFPRSPIAKACPLPHCYNGHFWEIFGMIPDMETPTFADMRDRVRADGTHWLHPRVLKAFQSKASDNNRRYSKIREWLLCRTAELKRKW